ncbi:hypothetical protein OG478_52855 (plasmid) [Streptomyces phaeochromogenes]|uniref:hypothetical protein n=1 Tax=Streptomyces phaeochromogenes TaxID=1923 RepID=UPI002F9124D2|nr:hypothetical protein OG478_52855 [Streptomyces phaeochromogenes]
MPFRKSISQAELRENLTPEQRASGPTYQASRGGWFPETAKPVPGTPKGDEPRTQ